jgi:hypothetical protein
MNSRERVNAALNHRQPDRAPIDLGATSVTGAQASIIYKLRQALSLSRPGEPVKVVEPYQMLGEVADDLKNALGVDIAGVGFRGTFFGYKLAGWKPWVTFDGTPVLVPGGYNTTPEPSGDILQYPEDDRSVPASARMPKGGFYFDAIIRQQPIDDAKLRVEDNIEEFTRVTEEDLEELRHTTETLYRTTPYALIGSFGGTSFGDIAFVPAPFLKRPKGIRDVAEWYMSTITRKDYVREIFQRQCEIALGNLELIRQAVGDKIAVFFSSGADFGTQNAPFISPDAYRELFQPFHKRVNGWVHRNTNWKCFMHSCGSVEPLISDIIDAGFDILNPVQTSAAGMDPRSLKSKYGDRIVFWGGLVDSQKTLPFGTVDEVSRMARERLAIFGNGGGYVANGIHNIQGGCPVENVIEMFRVARGA